MLSALTACQRQLESELLLARKDTRWCAEDGDQVSETVKVPGHVRGVGAQSPGARPGQRTPPLAVGCSGTQVTGTAQGRLLPGRRSWRLRAGQIRSEISHAFDLRPCFPRSTQLAQSEQWAARGPRACV